MNRLLPLVLVGIAATAAHAQDRESLPGLVAAFVAEKFESAGPDRQPAISQCILGAFEGLSDDELKTMIVVDNFERSFDNLLAVYPEREAIIEVCEDL